MPQPQQRGCTLVNRGSTQTELGGGSTTEKKTLEAFFTVRQFGLASSPQPDPDVDLEHFRDR